METVKDILTSPLFIDIISGLLSGFLGYVLGNRSWKKQFILKHFDLHEKVLNKLNAISNDEIEGFYFSKTDKEIKKMLKVMNIETLNQYVEKSDDLDDVLGTNEFGYPAFLAFGSIKETMQDIRYLSSRSNKRISKISKKMLLVWDKEAVGLDENIQSLADDFNEDPEEWKISKMRRKYIDYFEKESQELILLKIIPLVNKLKIELSKYLKNKE